MSDEKEYLKQEIDLLEPIEGENGKIETVTIKPFPLSVKKDLPAKEKLNVIEEAKYVAACTGLSMKELDKLCVPDYNSLSEAAFDYCVEHGHELAGVKLDSKTRQVTLFWSNSRVVSFKFPKLKHSKMAEEISDKVERTIFILEQITDLDREELDEMAYPDFRSLELVATDFLTKPAAYFRPKASRK